MRASKDAESHGQSGQYALGRWRLLLLAARLVLRDWPRRRPYNGRTRQGQCPGALAVVLTYNGGCHGQGVCMSGALTDYMPLIEQSKGSKRAIPSLRPFRPAICEVSSLSVMHKTPANSRKAMDKRLYDSRCN